MLKRVKIRFIRNIYTCAGNTYFREGEVVEAEETFRYGGKCYLAVPTDGYHTQARTVWPYDVVEVEMAEGAQV